MDFSLDVEQQLLRDSARRFFHEKLPYDRRRRHLADGTDAWDSLAEMGWLMLAVDERADGLASPLEDIAILAEEVGRAIAIEPFVLGGVLPGRLLSLAGTDTALTAARALALGEARVAVAIHERARRYATTHLATRATRGDRGVTLQGAKQVVAGGDRAGLVIVAATLDGSDDPALLLVPVATPGVTVSAYRAIDNQGVADVAFDNVVLPADSVIAEPAAARALLDRAGDEATLLLCADAVGCMTRALEMTGEYHATRKQFDQTLSSFQALQHGLAKLFIETVEARSHVLRAIAAANDNDPVARARAVSACKYRVLETARVVTGQAVHYHGGIGMTRDLAVGEHLRRMLVSEQLYGNGEYHLERYLRLSQAPVGTTGGGGDGLA